MNQAPKAHHPQPDAGAHLSMSLVAYAAALLLNQPEKIRCFRTFALDDPPLGKAC